MYSPKQHISNDELIEFQKQNKDLLSPMYTRKDENKHRKSNIQGKIGNKL